MLFRLILLIHFGNSVEAWLHNIHEAPRYNRGRIPRSSGRPNRPRGGPMANPPRIVSSSAGVAMDASENLDLDDDSEARSAFGTKEYWDDTYAEAFIAGCLCRKRKLGQIMIRCDDPSVSCFVYFTNDRILPSQRVS